MTDVPTLSTFGQFSERHPAFSVPTLRWIRFNAERNGFQSAFRKVGSRVLISEREFFGCVDRLNGLGGKEDG